MAVHPEPKRPREAEAASHDLAELCRLHDVSLDLLGRAHDVDGLIEAILDEYERRLKELPPDALDLPDPEDPRTGAKVRALVRFAAQASAIQSQARSAADLRERKRRVEEALAEARRWRERLETVVSALDAAILFVTPEGRVALASGAVETLLDGRAAEGSALPSSFHGIPYGGDGDLVTRGSDGTDRVLAVSRRALGGGGSDGEVVLIHDVTARRAAAEAEARVERLHEVLKTLGVLSHKINNPLTALLGRAQLLRARADADPAVAKSAEVVEESARRVADLIRELATVAKEARADAVERVLS
jgi:signal transduction histidine kinase